MSGHHSRSLLLLTVAAAAWLCAANPAAAQQPYYPGYQGYPGYYPPGPYIPPSAGYWYGSAAALDAYGQLGLSQEQARILREQANQAKLDTRVKAVDVTAYERANKYWYSDEQA